MRSGGHRRSGTCGWTGGGRELLRFLTVADPAVSRVRGLADAAVDGDPGLEVVDISPAGATLPMFDITTGTGDFVAEGVVSHNCFARNTHTYLDLDAGADFDSPDRRQGQRGAGARARAARAALARASRSRWAPTPTPTSGRRAATG